MTRWARAGNTQKHCKQPEDPTPWEDFAAQIPFKKGQSKKFKGGKVKKHSNINKKSINNAKFLRLQAKNAETGETAYSKSTKFCVDLEKLIQSRPVKDNIALNNMSINRIAQQVEDCGNASKAHASDVEGSIPVMLSVSEESESMDMVPQIDKKCSSKPQQKWKNNKPLTFEKNVLKLMGHNESPHGNGKTTNNSAGNFSMCSPQQKEQSIVYEDFVHELSNDANKSENTKRKRKKGIKKKKKNPDCVSITDRGNKSESKLKGNETIVSKKAQVKCNEDSSSIEYKSHDILKSLKNLNISLCEEGNLPLQKSEKKLNAFSKNKKKRVALDIGGRKKRRVDPCNISVSSAEIVEHADFNQNDPQCSDLSEVVNNFDESEIKDDVFLTKEASEGKSLKKRKKEIFLERRRRKRTQNGIILLPPKIENKLYRIKKVMRKKGLSGEYIKEVIRNERRKEELIFKKNKKTCFNCREYGHTLVDCPKTAIDSEQGTGICFKCGSTEHTSHKCSIKNSDFPFAKCFICQGMGHLSRHCAENKRGIYPKGGKCNLCGDINHLKKDCPKLFKVKEQVEVTAETMDVVTSVDAEIEEAKPVIKHGETVKIVKFHH